MSDDKLALVFLTNQTSDTYKLIHNYAPQQDTPTTADNMQFSDIAEFMSQHYAPIKFTVRERYKFWSSIKRKPGETPTELAARVRQMATTCDFPAIKNPPDEAMRTCFICAINNGAVLKSVFREPEEKLTFSKAVDIATEVEEAAKTAKAQMYSKPEEVHKIQTKKQYHHHQKSAPSSKQPSSTQTQCYCCGKKGHAMKDCRLSNPVCKFCGRKGHIEAACITKQKSSKVSLVTIPTINKLGDITSTSTKATTMLLEEDFAHFGYPHTIVSDNATTFSSAEFQEWCHYRGIKHLTGAPYHPATNGAAERLVQSFKQSMKKSKLPPRPALQEFLMQYRRTPLNTGFSPSQLLNGRQIRTKIDSLLPSPAHIAQERQATDATKSQQKEHSTVQHVRTRYRVGTPCYALYCGPRHTNSPRWVPATVIKVHGTRSFTVKVHPRGSLWKRHWEQLRPRYGISEDADPGFNYGDRPTPTIDNSTPAPQKDESTTQPPSDETNQQTVPEYGRHNPRRSGCNTNRKPRHPCNMNC